MGTNVTSGILEAYLMAVCWHLVYLTSPVLRWNFGREGLQHLTLWLFGLQGEEMLLSDHDHLFSANMGYGGQWQWVRERSILTATLAGTSEETKGMGSMWVSCVCCVKCGKPSERPMQCCLIGLVKFFLSYFATLPGGETACASRCHLNCGIPVLCIPAHFLLPSFHLC